MFLGILEQQPGNWKLGILGNMKTGMKIKIRKWKVGNGNGIVFCENIPTGIILHNFRTGWNSCQRPENVDV